jgi:hypothetical protein
MSDPESDEESESKGPNLVVIYRLIAVALAFAIGFAMMIVAPFHHRH